MKKCEIEIVRLLPFVVESKSIFNFFRSFFINKIPTGTRNDVCPNYRINNGLGMTWNLAGEKPFLIFSNSHQFICRKGMDPILLGYLD